MKIHNVLSGNQLIIRDYKKTDLNFLLSMWLDEENGKYMSDPTREYVDAAYQKALDTLEENSNGYYLVLETAVSKILVGSCCIFQDKQQKSCDIGYCIHKDYWQKGYGSEMLSLLLDWIRKQGWETVTAEVAVDNIASNALLKKFHFKVIKNTSFKKYNMDVSYKSYLYMKKL